jgi:hypothetical protein
MAKILQRLPSRSGSTARRHRGPPPTWPPTQIDGSEVSMKRTRPVTGLLGLLLMLATLGLHAAKPVDNDGDGYTDNRDCDDSNAGVWELNSCGLCEVEPLDGCGGSTCTDGDGDGYAVEGGSCGLVDCDDAGSGIYPGAPEICGDGIDQSCSGADEQCGSGGAHDNLVWADYPGACLVCHDNGEAGGHYDEVFNSTHYQWVGMAQDMVNQPGSLQGKLTNAVNSYCINIEGNWPICGSCHAGRGIKPGEGDTKANVDCLVCHNVDYALSRVRLTDGSMGPPAGTDQATLDGYVRNIAPPTRANCLKCHANAGGGDGVKRGDLSMALIGNADAYFDVHMNPAGPDLQCQDCHVFQNHLVIGKGSDLRPTDDPSRGSEIACTTCHTGFDSGNGHAGAGRRSEPDRHVGRVACQSCHIPTYAKVATEVHRDWRYHHDGTPADGFAAPGHPEVVKASNLIPQLRFWNRASDNYLMGDAAIIDPETGRYPTSRPLGDVQDGMLTPFKYKTAAQPINLDDNTLVMLDTFEYLAVSGDVVASIESGLVNTGYPADTPVDWVETDTFQMINHGVSPADAVADCTQCHMEAVDLDVDSMLDVMGYRLKGAKEQVCNQCHDGTKKLPRTWDRMHNHVDKGSTGIGCLFCHDFERPERGLCSPCDTACAGEYVDNVPYPHQCP